MPAGAHSVDGIVEIERDLGAVGDGGVFHEARLKIGQRAGGGVDAIDGARAQTQQLAGDGTPCDGVQHGVKLVGFHGGGIGGIGHHHKGHAIFGKGKAHGGGLILRQCRGGGGKGNQGCGVCHANGHGVPRHQGASGQ